MFNDFFFQGKTPKNNVCIQKTHKFTVFLFQQISLFPIPLE